MSINFLLRGFFIGLSIAAPVGPIGVLCIRRSLVGGRTAGLLTGLGAASADAIYGCVAGFGLTLISDILVGQQAWLRFFGGIFLCYLGVKTFFSKPAEQAIAIKGTSLTGMYVSTFFLTLTNPMTILSFAAIFAGLGLVNSQGNYFHASLLVTGVFLGSACWWLLLSGLVSLFRTRFHEGRLRWVNRISGIIILVFGLFALFG